MPTTRTRAPDAGRTTPYGIGSARIDYSSPARLTARQLDSRVENLFALGLGDVGPYTFPGVGVGPGGMVPGGGQPPPRPTGEAKPPAEDLYRYLAPYPAIDRVPIIVGQNLTL